MIPVLISTETYFAALCLDSDSLGPNTSIYKVFLTDRHMLIQVYVSYVEDYFSNSFLAELRRLMLIIYSEPKFVGRDSCYKLLPPTFLCELSNKIDQTLQ